MKKSQVTRAMDAGREAAHEARVDLERSLAETKAAYNAGADVAREARSTSRPVGGSRRPGETARSTSAAALDEEPDEL